MAQAAAPSSAEQWAIWSRKELPPVEMVAPGVWCIPVPMPDPALRYVNGYAFEVPDGLVLVDTGWPTGEALAGLRAGLASFGRQVSDVRGVLVTHMHLDHYGLAPRVREESGAWVAMHPADADAVRRFGTDDVLALRMVWLRDLGVPESDLAALADSSEDLEMLKDFGQPDRLVEDGERVLDGRWDLRAVWTPGHTPGHLCFRELGLGVLLSGDHLLPRITPNVSADLYAAADPLRDYEASLAVVDGFAPELGEVWPAHEYRFADAHQRVQALLDHHAHRLDEVRAFVSAGAGVTTWEVAAGLTWSRSWDQTRGSFRRFALGETESHLRLLGSTGELELRAGPPRTWTRAPDVR